MVWQALPANGPGGPLAAARATCDGPPTAYEVDGALYEVLPSWWPLVTLLPAGGWRVPLVLDMTHPDDAAVLRSRLHDRGDGFGVAELDQIATALVERATGRPWWVAEQLVAWSVAHWPELDGRLTMRGLGLAELYEAEPARAINVVHMAITEGADDKARRRFDESLYRPPARLAPTQAPTWMADQEGDDFMAAMSTMPTGARAAGGGRARS